MNATAVRTRRPATGVRTTEVLKTVAAITLSAIRDSLQLC